MKISVYLSVRTFLDQSGTQITIRERRLVRQTAEDRVIAVVEAPAGTRVRRKRDQYGFEQLLVPLSRSLWGRFFGEMVAIPAKYVIGKARHGECGLALLRTPPLESSRTSDDVAATV